MDDKGPATLDRETAQVKGHEENGAPAPRESPRGLLPVPEAVQRVMDAETRPMSEKARKFYRDNYVLQYHYGGQYVLYRRTSEGIEVLAVGDEEVGRVPRESPGDVGYMATGSDVEEWGGER